MIKAILAYGLFGIITMGIMLSLGWLFFVLIIHILQLLINMVFDTEYTYNIWALGAIMYILFIILKK